MSTANLFIPLSLSFLAVGFGMLINPHFYEKAIKEMVDNEGVFFLSSIMTLIVGYIIIDFRGVGSWAWVILLFGHLTVLKGLFLLLIPEKSADLSRFVMKKTGVLQMVSTTTLLLGIIFLILGLES
jgi:hypothetical protein